jgi:hypothetical protein
VRFALKAIPEFFDQPITMSMTMALGLVTR